MSRGIGGPQDARVALPLLKAAWPGWRFQQVWIHSSRTPANAVMRARSAAFRTDTSMTIAISASYTQIELLVFLNWSQIDDSEAVSRDFDDRHRY